MARAHTRVHVHVEFANPYLTCGECGQWVTGWHDEQRCGCEGTWWNEPCGCERAALRGACPSWGPVDGCQCERVLGARGHDLPPALDQQGEAAL